MKKLPIIIAITGFILVFIWWSSRSSSSFEAEVVMEKPTTSLGQLLSGHVVVTRKGKFVESELRDAELYILYISASW